MIKPEDLFVLTLACPKPWGCRIKVTLGVSLKELSVERDSGQSVDREA